IVRAAPQMGGGFYFIMNKDRVYHIYCDESRQCIDRYMVLGGIIINSEYVNTVYDTMRKYRDDFHMLSELKWSKVKTQKINEYKGFVDYFFALNNTDRMHFKSLIIDNHKVDVKKYSNGNK